MYVLEKRQVVKYGVESLNTAMQNGSTLSIGPLPRGLTVAELLIKAARKEGYSFWNYEPHKNNCQDFVVKVLQAHGLPIIWPKQPVDKLFQSQRIKYVTSHASDLASRADVIIYGCTNPICAPKPQSKLS